MFIIYHDVGGAHSTQTAAWVHLNRLPKDRPPTPEEIQAIPMFDRAEKSDQGRIIEAGIDEWGNRICTLGRQYTDKITIPALQDLCNLLGKNGEMLLVNMKDTINLLMKIGGFSSRRLHLVSFGRPIVTKGTIQAYPNILRLVDSVKMKIKPSENQPANQKINNEAFIPPQINRSYNP